MVYQDIQVKAKCGNCFLKHWGTFFIFLVDTNDESKIIVIYAVYKILVFSELLKLDGLLIDTVQKIKLKILITLCAKMKKIYSVIGIMKILIFFKRVSYSFGWANQLSKQPKNW